MIANAISVVRLKASWIPSLGGKGAVPTSHHDDVDQSHLDKSGLAWVSRNVRASPSRKRVSHKNLVTT